MGISNIISAFGLSSAAGLNAYIPLLIVAVLGRFGFLNLSHPWDILTSWWSISAIGLLGAIEFVVDKVPGADHLNDLVQTFIRPAAGAVLFAANSGFVNDISPVLSLVIGLVMAGGVHATKAVTRPVVNTATMGVGAPVISVAEDALSAVSSLLAVFMPPVFLLLAAFIGWFVFRMYRRMNSRRAAQAGPTIVVKY